MRQQVTAGLNADVSTPLTQAWTVNTHAEWMYRQYRSLLPDGISLNKTLPYVLVSGSTRYTIGGGWSGEVSGLYKSSVLRAQAIIRPTGRLNLALRKKLWNNKATLTLAGNDVLRTGSFIREIYLPGAQAHFINVLDRRQVLLTFSYSFGKKVEKMETHASGAESEKARL